MDVAVPGVRGDAIRCQSFGELDGDHHRPVPASSAPDGDVHGVPSPALGYRDDPLEQRRGPLDELDRHVVTEYEVADRCVEAGEWSQGGLPEGIGEDPAVDDPVGLDLGSVLE